jgi:ubiquinone biosynthesis protein Coq4
LALAAAFAHAGFVAPERIAEIYDAAAAGWFGTPVRGPAVASPLSAFVPPSADFWTQFWSLVGAASGLGSGDATSRTAFLSGLLEPSLQPRVAEACLAYPGVESAARAGLPGRIALADLAACPVGSLGEAFYRLIVDNNFDLEVLDRDALGLATLIPPLDYLNTRVLQTHDLWHIVGGYQTTKLHEVAISAFQMAQFGHGYSAVFLALIATTAALGPAEFFTMLMDTVLSAWVHGRGTPPMLLIPWEQVWGETTEQIRARFSVVPYDSPYPADVFEQYEADKTLLAI